MGQVHQGYPAWTTAGPDDAGALPVATPGPAGGCPGSFPYASGRQPRRRGPAGPPVSTGACRGMHRVQRGEEPCRLPVPYGQVPAGVESAHRIYRGLPGDAPGTYRSLPEPPAAEGGHPAVLPGALTVRAGWFPVGIPGPAGGCRGRPLRLYRACGRVSVREKGR